MQTDRENTDAPGQVWEHKKTGHMYTVVEPGIVMNATNAQDGQLMVVYRRTDGSDAQVYVREQEGSIEFRLANADHPEIWERHGWIDMDIIKRGAKIFKEERKGKADPTAIYDLETAWFLIKESKKK